MTFKTIAMKNLRYNIKKYIIFIGSGSLTIMVFYLITSLYFNEAFMDKAPRIASEIILMAILLLGFFSLFYSFFCYNLYIKAKSKEIGLYQVMGLSKKTIERIVAFEMIGMTIITILLGLTMGILFSYIFLLGALRFTNLGIVSFQIDYAPIGITFITYSFFYALAMVIQIKHVSKQNVIHLMKATRVSDFTNKFSSKTAILGFAIIIASFTSALYLRIHIEIPYVMLYFIISVFMSLVGLYLMLSNLSALIIHVLKGRRKWLSKNMISIKELDYRYYHYKNAIFLLTILCGITLLAEEFAFSSYVTLPRYYESFELYDMVVVSESKEVININEALEDFMESEKITPSTYITFTCPIIKIIGKDGSGISYSGLLSTSQYNQLTNKHVNLFYGDWLYTHSTYYDVGYYNYWGPFYYKNGDELIEIPVISETSHVFINASTWENTFLVVNDIFYDELENNLKAMDSRTYHLLNFENKNVEEQVYIYLTSLLDDPEHSIYTKKHYIDKQRKEISFTAYLTLSVSIAFLVALCSSLYFKLISDMDIFKDRYKKLFRIGITVKEMKKIIKRIIAPIFIAESLLGSIYSFYYFFVLAWESPSSLLQQHLINILIIIAAFSASQFIFYKMMVHKITTSITNN